MLQIAGSTHMFFAVFPLRSRKSSTRGLRAYLAKLTEPFALEGISAGAQLRELSIVKCDGLGAGSDIFKQLSTKSGYRWYGPDGEVMRVLPGDIINPWPYRKSLPVPYMKRSGVSHNIGKEAPD